MNELIKAHNELERALKAVKLTIDATAKKDESLAEVYKYQAQGAIKEATQALLQS